MTNTSTLEPQWVRLPNYQLVIVDGQDAKTFLQGQVTCNINDLTNENSLLGCHCNAKGRVLFDFRAALLADNQVALRIRSNMESIVRASLSKYIVFSKAKLLSNGANFSFIGTIGITKNTLQSQLPDEAFNQLKVIEITDSLLEIWVPADLRDMIEQYLSCFPQGNESAWQQERFKTGVAELSPELSEQYLPQELDLDEAGAINFKKGCYTGQEVIARLHYKGVSKRHLYIASVKSADTPLIGQKITSSTNQLLGEVIEFQPMSDDEGIALISAITEIENYVNQDIDPINMINVRKAFNI